MSSSCKALAPHQVGCKFCPDRPPPVFIFVRRPCGETIGCPKEDSEKALKRYCKRLRLPTSEAQTETDDKQAKIEKTAEELIAAARAFPNQRYDNFYNYYNINYRQMQQKYGNFD